MKKLENKIGKYVKKKQKNAFTFQSVSAFKN